MKVTRIYDQHRRDCSCDSQCESCGQVDTDKYAYDDANFWNNVMPKRKCSKCGKTTFDSGEALYVVTPRYAPHEVV